jgi:hypothetical protein
MTSDEATLQEILKQPPPVRRAAWAYLDMVHKLEETSFEPHVPVWQPIPDEWDLSPLDLAAFERTSEQITNLPTAEGR